MQITLLPKTTLGKWSTGLLVAAFLAFIVFIIGVALGFRGGDTLDFSNFGPAVPILLAGVFVIASTVTGIIGIVKSKERSIIVFLATALGVFALIFIAGEFLVPH